MRGLSRAVEFALTVGQTAGEHDIKYPAAALAYYAFVSQIPVLILAVAVLSDRLVRQIRTTTPDFLTPGAQQLLSDALVTASGRVWAALLAVGILVWSGANIVIGFQTVVNRVENIPRESLRTRLHDTSSIIGSFALVIVAVILTNVLFALLPVGRVLSYSKPFVQFCTLTVAFLPLYYFPSRVVTSLSDALPGALTAAVGWTILLTIVSFYAANATRYALYGVLSGIIIILTSFYIGAIILMIGAIVNVVIADTDDSEELSRRYRREGSI
ncbi:YihY/virulence factor BrkB family protein [Halorubrum sp. AD140]|uniref:YihY/virulence factor BrkB family protein n=1 Tax=Halorubrum sp. AD140 TaxID=3050073 RepID=UPI002ACC9048|nr:YihY/virulence factor BrkB family protein [Halorubrum sp. AD140]MDZ5811176.1 YihY/virulence factor BrkB family protein [Halorubrum sp. AD140]